MDGVVTVALGAALGLETPVLNAIVGAVVEVMLEQEVIVVVTTEALSIRGRRAGFKSAAAATESKAPSRMIFCMVND